MSNNHSPDKESLSVRVPRELHRALEIAADVEKKTLSDFIREKLQHATKDIELTAEDYRKIADDIDRAMQLARAKAAQKKTLDARFKPKTLS